MTRGVSRLQQFWHKLTHWEFWSLDTFYFPIKIYYLWLSLKNRSMFFISASNPTIEFGGFSGERKTKIYDLIPNEYLPETLLVAKGDVKSAIESANKIGYPLIVKPNVGERGRFVEKIENELSLIDYAERCPVDFLVQTLVDLPLELGIFYIRNPNEKFGRLTSIVQKEFMSVTGDGKSTVRQLLSQKPRAVLQLDFDHARFTGVMNQVPKNGETLRIESIGNHCRGTIFLNRNDLIDDELTEAFDQLSKRIDGFYYGRYDLRCQSIEELKQLKNFKIIELNGAGAEPAHIYQPGYPLFRAYKDVFWHYRQMSQVSRANKQLGHQYWSHKKGMQMLRKVKAYQKVLNQS